ncbi:MAG TPA: LON peptidase substrate-binding domain-containing protein [Oleiagrimonas sp.]|nr:LON peptidase substrate-binding domain-containing protein [Oleiagrimonas sp.]
MARDTSQLSDIPLFPLATVLFPGGPLELRIFEPRYLDLVRECTRAESCFGVCLILGGSETGAPAVPAAIGTLARITDFFTNEEGILGICAEGGTRFRVDQARVRDDGQLRGDIACWPDEPVLQVPPEFGLLVTILRRLVEQMAPPWKNADEARYDDAGWIGFRMAELLPLDASERQQLLEMADPLERLTWLRDALPRFQRA